MTTRASASDRPPGGSAIDWGRVADGIGLAGFGVFFLLATTHGLPPGFWLEALSFWPVLLISAGIRVVFDRSPLPWGVVLGPLVVLATLVWLAWGEAPKSAPPGPWREVSASRPADVSAVRLDLQAVGARVEIESRAVGPGILIEGRSASRGSRARIRERADGRTVTLTLEGHEGPVTIVPGRRSVWDLALADDLPVQIELGGVMSRSDLRLERAIVSRVTAQGPFQSIELRLPPPTLPTPVPIELGGPFCSFHVVVPDGTPVQLSQTGPINVVLRGPAQDEPLGDRPGYAVSLTGPFCLVTIEEAPLPPGVSPRPVTPPAPRPPAEAPVADPAERLPAEAPEAAPAVEAR